MCRYALNEPIAKLLLNLAAVCDNRFGFRHKHQPCDPSVVRVSLPCQQSASGECVDRNRGIAGADAAQFTQISSRIVLRIIRQKKNHIEARLIDPVFFADRSAEGFVRLCCFGGER